MLTISTAFWRANRHSAPASRCYTEDWVNRLAAGFRRNLTVPHRFVALTDKEYSFATGIQQERLSTAEPTWFAMIEPFRLEGPLIVVGLDTIVTGDIDHMAKWCETADRIALPRSPGKDFACTGAALVPAGKTDIYVRWRGENDMEWLRRQPHVFTDDLWPGQVLSYRLQARPNGVDDARIIYFHGRDKPHELAGDPLIEEHWRL